MDVVNVIKEPQIIAATRSDEEFRLALRADPAMLFDLDPDILTTAAKIKLARAEGKRLYLHLDLAHGIGRDASGIRYLARLGVDGIITTKTSLVKLAREQGLATVQRFFILDSRSVESTIEALKSAHPDMIEIMPGVVPKTVRKLRELTDIPIIVGGLVETPEEVREAFAAGAAAVSTGRRELWGL